MGLGDAVRSECGVGAAGTSAVTRKRVSDVCPVLVEPGCFTLPIRVVPRVNPSSLVSRDEGFFAFIPFII